MDARQRGTVMALGFCGLVSAADNWFVSPALPSIANTLGVLPSVATIILTAYLIPYGCLQPVCGALGDKVGRLRMLRIIVCGLTVSTVLCSMASSLEMLIVARVITGCFAAGIIAVSQVLAGDAVSAEDRPRAIALLMGITYAGQGLSAGLGGAITGLVGWRAAFMSFAVLGVIALLGLSRLHESADDRAARAADAQGAGLVDMVRLSGHLVLGVGRKVYGTALATGVIFLGVYGFFGTFLAERCGLDAMQAGLLMMGYGFACLVGSALTGRLAGRIGVARTLALGEIAGLCSIALLLAAQATTSWVPALAAAVLLGAGYIMVQPTLATRALGLDAQHAGLCTGFTGFGMFVGGGIGSTLGRMLLGAGGYGLLWIAAAIALVVQLIVSLRLYAGE
ncbi:MFS transporter [Collinsella sp. An271]|uniref:MFS transporter n=1 Tax=Collinsella sp. An271 TaxID=1965616 RepID=UPI001302BD57|nr:MFS transporter [Collinsella sp. An271]